MISLCVVPADESSDLRIELLIPDLISRESRESWDAAGAADMPARAQEKARRILAEHQPHPLPDGVAAELDKIVKEAEDRADTS